MQAILSSRTVAAAALLSVITGGIDHRGRRGPRHAGPPLRREDHGELDGQTENRIYVRTSFADQPKVPIDQIAMIDVGGDAINPSADELAQAAGSSHLLIPKSGAPMKGQFIRLEGSLGDADPKPPVVVFKKESGEETRLPVNEMRRLYLGNYTPPSTQSTSTTSGSSSAPLAVGERPSRCWATRIGSTRA